jgi:hypothetical protein
MFLFERIGPFFDVADAGGGGGNGGGEAWAAPEGLPAEFAGTTADETLSKLLPAFNDVNGRVEGLRTKLAQMPARPDTADAYSFEADDKLKPWLGDLKDNPAWDHARKAAFEAGLSQDQLQKFIGGVYGPMADAGMLSTPFDPAAEVNSFMTASGMDRTAATTALQNTEAFANGLGAQLKGVPESMKADVQALLVSMTDTAAGNFLLQALSGRLSENGIRVSGEGGSQGVLSDEDVKQLHSDPRIDPRNRNHPDPDKRFDEELRKRYDEACNRKK